MNNKINLNKNFQQQLPINIQNILLKISKASNKSKYKVYLVGGVVRDLILGKNIFDVDLLIEGDAINFALFLQQKNLCNIVQINKDFKTCKVEIDGILFDIASTRAEIYEKPGHLPKITKFNVNLEKDCSRRDFTINSLYLSLNRENFLDVIDFLGGVIDINNKYIKILHINSFIDDPTRILRALKFRYRFNFTLSDITKKCQVQYLNNPNYNICFSRVKSEFIQTFNLNIAKIYETFIKEEIYKIYTNEVESKILPNDIYTLIKKYEKEISSIWLIYFVVLQKTKDTVFSLTKNERNILNTVFDISKKNTFNDNYKIYKTFSNIKIEALIIYFLKTKDTNVIKYLDNLKHIKLKIKGSDLIKLGIKPSKKFSIIFDEVLKYKLNHPFMTLDDEINFVKRFI